MNARTKVKNNPGIFSRPTRGGTVYDVSYRIDGKLRWSNGHKTLTEAKAAQTSIRHSKLIGETPALTTPTLAEFVQTVWKPHVEHRVAIGKLQASTATIYNLDVENHVLPALGDAQLAAITDDRIEALQTKLIRAGKSLHTTRRVTNTLSGILTLAVKRRLLRANPCLAVEKPAPTQRKAQTLTLDQVLSLAEATPNRTLRVLVLAAALAGMRQSELFGLRWENVSLTEGAESIVVVEQHYRGETKASTKTPQGRRLIPIPGRLAAELRTLNAEQQVEGHPNPHGLVFPTPTGLYTNARRFDGRWAGMTRDGKRSQGIRDKAGLPTLHFHDLRAFYVSEIRASGLPTSYTEQLVGHTSDAVHRGYTSPTADQEAAIRAGLEARFGSAE